MQVFFYKGWPLWGESFKEKLENKDARDIAQNLYLSQTLPLLHLTTALCFIEDNASQSVSSVSGCWKGTQPRETGEILSWCGVLFNSPSLTGGSFTRRSQDSGRRQVKDMVTGLEGKEVTDKLVCRALSNGGQGNHWCSEKRHGPTRRP